MPDKCPSCSAPLSNSPKFCPNCGTKIEILQANEEKTAVQPEDFPLTTS